MLGSYKHILKQFLIANCFLGLSFLALGTEEASSRRQNLRGAAVVGDFLQGKKLRELNRVMDRIEKEAIPEVCQGNENTLRCQLAIILRMFQTSESNADVIDVKNIKAVKVSLRVK